MVILKWVGDLVNFDNAATTFPKPTVVRNAAMTAMTTFGGNPGRSGHSLSINTAKAVYNARNTCAKFFGAETENVVFTLNCTHALNLAIKGIMGNGGHIITSNMEHNSVSRPIFALSKHGCSYDIAKVSKNDDETVANFEALIANDTKAIACTVASNVTGQILPYKRLAALCKKYKICFIVDGAQGCGILPIKLSDGINIICTAGHKGLYGPTGTGLLITDGQFPISAIIEGGTGSSSLELEQPDFLPDSLEAGTINTVGAIALGAGVDFVNKMQIRNIYSHEEKLCNQFINGISPIKGISIYRNSNCAYVPIVSFNLVGYTANELAQVLSDKGFGLRGGLHCAALTHNALGTVPDGTIRFAPSIFNTSEQVGSLILIIRQLGKK